MRTIYECDGFSVEDDLAGFEIVKILIRRLEESNALEFVDIEDRQKLIELLKG